MWKKEQETGKRRSGAEDEWVAWLFCGDGDDDDDVDDVVVDVDVKNTKQHVETMNRMQRMKMSIGRKDAAQELKNNLEKRQQVQKHHKSVGDT